MRTPYSNGKIHPTLVASEVKKFEQVGERLVEIGTMQPLDPKVSEAAQQAATSLSTILEMIRPKAAEGQPILDEIEKKSGETPATPPADSAKPPEAPPKPATPPAAPPATPPKPAAPPAAPPAGKPK